jgi:hypothetical protein
MLSDEWPRIAKAWRDGSGDKDIEDPGIRNGGKTNGKSP